MPVGLICYAKRLGMHETDGKAASCFPEVFRKGARNRAPLPRTTLLMGSNRVHRPQRFTSCRLTALPSSVALAGSYPKVPEGRSSWLTNGARWSKTLIIPRLDSVLE